MSPECKRKNQRETPVLKYRIYSVIADEPYTDIACICHGELVGLAWLSGYANQIV